MFRYGFKELTRLVRGDEDFHVMPTCNKALVGVQALGLRKVWQSDRNRKASGLFALSNDQLVITIYEPGGDHQGSWVYRLDRDVNGFRPGISSPRYSYETIGQPSYVASEGLLVLPAEHNNDNILAFDIAKSKFTRLARSQGRWSVCAYGSLVAFNDEYRNSRFHDKPILVDALTGKREYQFPIATFPRKIVPYGSAFAAACNFGFKGVIIPSVGQYASDIVTLESDGPAIMLGHGAERSQGGRHGDATIFDPFSRFAFDPRGSLVNNIVYDRYRNGYWAMSDRPNRLSYIDMSTGQPRGYVIGTGASPKLGSFGNNVSVSPNGTVFFVQTTSERAIVYELTGI